MAFQNRKIEWIPAALISCILYFLLAYKLERTDTVWLQLAFAGLFIAYIFLLKLNAKWVLGFSLLFRLIFLFSIPALSDDFYRFIWDGLLWHQGIHPFGYLPSHFMEPGNRLPALNPALYSHLNSKEYHTIYPPLHQLVFWLSTFSYSGNILEAVVPMRLILLACDMLFIVFLTEITKNDGSPPARHPGLYALNPLVIIECTGNLHFEGMLVFFLAVAIYVTAKDRLLQGSLAVAAAIATKLTPLLAVPALLMELRKPSWGKYAVYTCAFCMLFFLPLLGPAWLAGQGKSLELYFRKFEFNASVYYLFRELGFLLKGYNIIGTLGPLLALVSGVLILFVSWSKWIKPVSIFQRITLAFFIFYLFATTVHPWYIVPVLGLSAFTPYRFPAVWSYTVLWTYAGYTGAGFEEPLLLIIFEYVLVIGIFVWEILEEARTKAKQNTL